MHNRGKIGESLGLVPEGQPTATPSPRPTPGAGATSPEVAHKRIKALGFALATASWNECYDGEHGDYRPAEKLHKKARAEFVAALKEHFLEVAAQARTVATLREENARLRANLRPGVDVSEWTVEGTDAVMKMVEDARARRALETP